MPCIDRSTARCRAGLAALLSLGWLTSCATQHGVATGATARATADAAPVADAILAVSTAPRPAAVAGVVPSAVASVPAATAVRLAAPGPVRSWTELRRQAALRLVAANPQATYLGVVPDVLLAIPVLEIELNGDGSIRKIEVLRKPGQALDTVQLAIDAVRRAAPFGDVSRLPKPWRFTETFLFDDARLFKPRTLD